MSLLLNKEKLEACNLLQKERTWAHMIIMYDNWNSYEYDNNKNRNIPVCDTVNRTLGINMCKDTQKFSKLWSSMHFSAAAETDIQHFWK